MVISRATAAVAADSQSISAHAAGTARRVSQRGVQHRACTRRSRERLPIGRVQERKAINQSGSRLPRKPKSQSPSILRREASAGQTTIFRIFSPSAPSLGADKREQLAELFFGRLPAVLADLEGFRILEFAAPFFAVPGGQLLAVLFG